MAHVDTSLNPDQHANQIANKNKDHYIYPDGRNHTSQSVMNSYAGKIHAIANKDETLMQRLRADNIVSANGQWNVNKENFHKAVAHIQQRTHDNLPSSVDIEKGILRDGGVLGVQTDRVIRQMLSSSYQPDLGGTGLPPVPAAQNQSATPVSQNTTTAPGMSVAQVQDLLQEVRTMIIPELVAARAANPDIEAETTKLIKEMDNVYDLVRKGNVDAIARLEAWEDTVKKILGDSPAAKSIEMELRKLDDIMKFVKDGGDVDSDKKMGNGNGEPKPNPGNSVTVTQDSPLLPDRKKFVDQISVYSQASTQAGGAQALQGNMTYQQQLREAAISKSTEKNFDVLVETETEYIKAEKVDAETHKLAADTAKQKQKNQLLSQQGKEELAKKFGREKVKGAIAEEKVKRWSIIGSFGFQVLGGLVGLEDRDAGRHLSRAGRSLQNLHENTHDLNAQRRRNSATRNNNRYAHRGQGHGMTRVAVKSKPGHWRNQGRQYA